jgi:hypothetical protein
MRAIDLMVFMFIFLAIANVLTFLSGVSVIPTENAEYAPISQQNGQWSETNWWRAVAGLLPLPGLNFSNGVSFVLSFIEIAMMLTAVGTGIALLWKFIGGTPVSDARLMLQVIGISLFGVFYFSYAGKVSIIFANLPFLDQAGLGWLPLFFGAFAMLVGLIGVMQLSTGVSARFAE